MIFLFAGMETGYTQIFQDQGSTSEKSPGLYSNTITSDNPEENKTATGLFKSNSAPDPGGRPGDGGAIGKDVPLGNGITALSVCFVLLVVAKETTKKFKKFRRGC